VAPLVLTYSFDLPRALGVVDRDPGLPSHPLWHPSRYVACVERQLTAAQVEPIRRLLEDEHDWRAGIERYRQVVPDAELAEAQAILIRLYLALRAEHPRSSLCPFVVGYAQLECRAGMRRD